MNRIRSCITNCLLLAWPIGAAAAQSGDATAERYASADWWLAQVRESVDDLSASSLRDQVWNELHGLQVGVGDLESASAAAAKVSDPQQRVYALTGVAKQYLKRGDDESCRRLLDQARDTPVDSVATRIFTRAHIVRSYVETGHADAAEAFVAGMTDERGRHIGHGDLATALARGGEVDRALELIASKLPARWGQNALARVADELATAARKDEVTRVVELLESEAPRDEAYGSLVVALVRADRRAEAEEYVGRIGDPVRRLAARELVGSGATEGIAGLRARLREVSTREETLAVAGTLVEGLIAAKDVEGAAAAIEAMVSAIESSPRRAATSKFGRFDDRAAIAQARAHYLQTARLLAGRGDREQALEHLARARDAVLAVPEDAGLGKSMPLMALVETQIELGELIGARRTIDGIQEEFLRSMLACILVRAFLDAGDIPSALDQGKSITVSSERAKALGAVAVALVRAGDVAAGKRLLDEIGVRQVEARVYRRIGRAMLEQDRGAELHEWLADLPPAARAYACMGAAAAIAQRR